MNIDKTATALLVIDAIEAVGDDSIYDPDANDKAYRDNVAAVVSACHGAGIPVIYCNDAHVRGIDRELELWGEHGVAGEVRVIREVEQAEGDITIPKRRYSGFFQTDLDLTLRGRGARGVAALSRRAKLVAARSGGEARSSSLSPVGPLACGCLHGRGH